MLPLLIPIAALALSAATAGYGMVKSSQAEKERRRQDEELRRQMAKRPDLPESQATQEQLAAARAQVGAPSGATMAAYRAAQQQAADQRGYAQRNASSGAQALAASSGAAQQTNSILPAIAQQQQQFNMASLGNLNQALQLKTEDDRMRHEQRMGKYSDMVNYNLGRVAAAQQNKGQYMAMGLQGVTSGLGYAGQLAGTGIQPTTTRPDVAPMTQLQPVGGSMTTAPSAYQMQPYPTSYQYSPLMSYYQQNGYYNPYAF